MLPRENYYQVTNDAKQAIKLNIGKRKRYSIVEGIQMYDVMGAPDAVSNRHYPEENHDYGLNKIDATIDFLTPRLRLDSAAMRTAKNQPDLDSIRIRSRSELCSTTDTHPLPDHAMQGDEVVWKAYLALPRDE